MTRQTKLEIKNFSCRRTTLENGLMHSGLHGIRTVSTIKLNNFMTSMVVPLLKIDALILLVNLISVDINVSTINVFEFDRFCILFRIRIYLSLRRYPITIIKCQQSLKYQLINEIIKPNPIQLFYTFILVSTFFVFYVNIFITLNIDSVLGVFV